MKSKYALIAMMLALPALAAESKPAGADAQPAVETTALAFAEAMDTCAEAAFKAPHPFAKGFIIQHRILGTTDQKCVYSQSMPGDMNMECALSPEGQASLAHEFREQAEGRMSGSTAKRPVWSSECAIVDKDGKRTPMAS